MVRNSCRRLGMALVSAAALMVLVGCSKKESDSAEPAVKEAPQVELAPDGFGFRVTLPAAPQHTSKPSVRGPVTTRRDNWTLDAADGSYSIIIASSTLPGTGPMTPEALQLSLDAMLKAMGVVDAKPSAVDSVRPAVARDFTVAGARGQARVYAVDRAMTTIIARGTEPDGWAVANKVLASFAVPGTPEADPEYWAVADIPGAPLLFEAPGASRVTSRDSEERVSSQYIIADNHGVDFAVIWHQIKSPMDAAAQVTAIGGMIDSMAQMAQRTDWFERSKTTLGSLQGLEARFEGTQKQAPSVVWIRAYANANTRLAVMVTGPKAGFSEARAKRFFDSVKARP